MEARFLRTQLYNVFGKNYDLSVLNKRSITNLIQFDIERQNIRYPLYAIFFLSSHLDNVLLFQTAFLPNNQKALF